MPKQEKTLQERTMQDSSFMYINVSILNKVLVNQIQQCIKRITQHEQVGFISGL